MNGVVSRISIRGVRFNYGEHGLGPDVISSCNFDIRPGESVAIVGESGSGKSTLLGILGGILKPASGTYAFEGTPLPVNDSGAMASFRRDNVGYVFQNFCLLPQLNLLENVLLPIKISRIRGSEWVGRATELLARLGLDGLERRYPNEISGGQAQRVAIARALIRSPRLLLADEPTGNLDAATASSIADTLVDGLDGGCSLVLVTHSKSIANRMQRIVEMKDGRLEGRL